MFGSVGSYLMAAFGMAFAGTSALALIYTIGHLDSPEVPPAGASGSRIVTVVPPDGGQSTRIEP